MKAQLIIGFRDASPDGLIEAKIWRLPEAVPPCTHTYKYRLAFVVDGERVVGFDNERGKGDHCHVGGEESPYEFSDIDQLIEDFTAEVQRWRNER